MIAVAGEALVDLVLTPDGALTPALGGAPFNTARTCARLGVATAFMGAISTDRFGTLLRAALAESGVALDDVQAVDVPTTLALAEIDARGAASYRFYLEGTSAPSFTQPPGWPARSIDALFTGGLALVLEPMAATVADLVAGVPAEALVMVDVNCRPAVVADRSLYLARLGDVLRRADVVKVSDDDLAFVSPGEDPVDAARALLQHGPTLVLVTRGAAGVVALTSHGRVDVPVEPVEVVDTIGAGDAFGGGFLAWWTARGNTRTSLGDLAVVERAVRRANVVAGVVCARRGADPPRRHELPDDWMH